MRYKPKFWEIKELVSPRVYEKFGQSAWKFFDIEYLIDLDTIRKAYNSTLYINNWAFGGSYTESGLRENISEIVKSKTNL